MCKDKDCLRPDYTPEELLDHILHHIAEDFGPSGVRREETLTQLKRTLANAYPGDRCTIHIPYDYPITEHQAGKTRRTSGFVPLQ